MPFRHAALSVVVTTIAIRARRVKNVAMVTMLKFASMVTGARGRLVLTDAIKRRVCVKMILSLKLARRLVRSVAVVKNFKNAKTETGVH